MAPIRPLQLPYVAWYAQLYVYSCQAVVCIYKFPTLSGSGMCRLMRVRLAALLTHFLVIHKHALREVQIQGGFFYGEPRICVCGFPWIEDESMCYKYAACTFWAPFVLLLCAWKMTYTRDFVRGLATMLVLQCACAYWTAHMFHWRACFHRACFHRACFIGAHVSLARMFHWRACFIGAHVSLARMFHWSACFIGVHVSLARMFHWRACFICAHVSSVRMFHWRACSLIMHAQDKDSFYKKALWCLHAMLGKMRSDSNHGQRLDFPVLTKLDSMLCTCVALLFQLIVASIFGSMEARARVWKRLRERMSQTGDTWYGWACVCWFLRFEQLQRFPT